MRSILALLFIALTLQSYLQEAINEVKGIEKTWQHIESEEESRFKGMDKYQIRAQLGYRPHTVQQTVQLQSDHKLRNLPDNFDSITNWPQCTFGILDQGHCGSCWAFATSEAFGDRLCIASGGKIHFIPSPQELVSCDIGLDQGCDGGYEYYAYKFIEKNGLLSLADYPYLSGTDGKTRVCNMTGKSGKETHHGVTGSTKDVAAKIDTIKEEIMTKGPVSTGFTVYKDFMTYKSGIYVRTSTEAEGGHAVKIVGWGVENGVNYWKVANSWGPAWGENGYFRIKMDQCGFEQGVAKVDAKV
jgi:cathepsin B